MSKRSKTLFSYESLSRDQWDTRKLKQILETVHKIRLLVVGDLGLDRYTHGVVERISPEAPVPVVLVKKQNLKLGLAANVAENIHALQASALLLGVVGQDSAAEALRALLKEKKMDLSGLMLDKNRQTVLKDRVVSGQQQLLRIDYESSGSVSPDVQELILKKIKSSLKSRLKSEVHALIIQDYAKGLFDPNLSAKIFSQAKKYKKLTVVDPHIKSNPKLYVGASVLTPNTLEAEALSGMRIENRETLALAGLKILKKTAVQHLVLTRGADGMALFSRDSQSIKLIPTAAREVYDVSGAGDTVVAALSLALACQASLEEAAILGNIAAGLVVAKRGTATVSLSELRQALQSV